jgi:hypothetical protein
MFPISGPKGQSRRATLLQPSPQNTQCYPIPAPNAGINAVDGLAGMKPDEAIFMFNMIPSQYGSRVRTGYRAFTDEVDPDGIRTLIPFNGSDSADDRLFACGEAGIYDITAGGVGPWAPDIAFLSTGVTSGQGIWNNFTTIAGHFSQYCDELNGYYVYTESSTTWAKVAMGGGASEISGVDPALFSFVTTFKSRAWFVEKDSARAWYLPVGAIFGAATVFNFGNKFKHGGTLVALYNWTVDGGEGIDDYLVAISSSGDVVVYKGNDPSTATDFLQHGSWYIGPPPAGRRLGGSFGGELYLLSTYGLLPMSKLISGTLVQQDQIYLTRKITPLIQEQMAFSRTVLGWEVKLIPSEQLLLVSAPKRTGFEFLQFVQSLNTEGWASYQSIPYYTGEVLNGTFYIASSDGIVYTHEGDLDNVSLDDSTSDQIEWSVLQTFQEAGDPGYFKRTHFIRPVFLAEEAPSYVVEARYDYNLSQVFGAPAASVTAGALWDSAIWDTSVWAGDFAVIDNLRGAAGMGRTIAIGINGQSGTRTILVRYDVMKDQGGML